jgi:hypothetical protein
LYDLYLDNAIPKHQVPDEDALNAKKKQMESQRAENVVKSLSGPMHKREAAMDAIAQLDDDLRDIQTKIDDLAAQKKEDSKNTKIDEPEVQTKQEPEKNKIDETDAQKKENLEKNDINIDELEAQKLENLKKKQRENGIPEYFGLKERKMLFHQQVLKATKPLPIKKLSLLWHPDHLKTLDENEKQGGKIYFNILQSCFEDGYIIERNHTNFLSCKDSMKEFFNMEVYVAHQQTPAQHTTHKPQNEFSKNNSTSEDQLKKLIKLPPKHAKPIFKNKKNYYS